jgi:DNA-binding NarL/FixJ family response regulator
VVEHWEVLRHGLTAVLRELGVATTAEAATGTAALTVVGADRPDLVVVGSCRDVATPLLVQRLVHACPGLGCLVLVDPADPAHDPVALLKAGAMGLVPRTACVEELEGALGPLFRGHRHVNAAALLRRAPLLAAHEDETSNELTARERAVLAIRRAVSQEGLG